MEKLTVIKIGGNVIDDLQTLNRFLDDFAGRSGAKLLVHGGGKIAGEVAAALGVESRMVEGRRITSAAMLRVVTMVYGGLVNKQLVSGLQARGCNALGLSGADGNLIAARKRPAREIDYGFAESNTTAGVIGVKVWIYKGEYSTEVDEETQSRAAGARPRARGRH